MTARAAWYALLLAGAAASGFPFLWMVSTALKSPQAALAPTLTLLPDGPHWGNFAEAFAVAPFGRYFFNTFVVSLTTTTAVTLTAVLAGYAFARLRFRGRDGLFFLTLITMMIPFEATLIPNFMLVHRLGWYDSYAGLIAPWCANAFSIFLMRQAFLALPSAYYDAAVADGCGPLRYLFFVAAPLAKASAVTAALFAFLSAYNSLVWPLVITGSESMRVVQVGLTLFAGEIGIRFNLLMAASAVVMAPPLCVYFAAQRTFIESAIGAGLKA